MPYPRELNLDPETEQKLIAYLNTELVNHYAERGQWMDDVLKWQKDYWAKPTKEKATFPFTGAAVIVIPLTAIAVEAVHARTMTTMFALPQFVTADPIDPDWEDAARPVERALDHELRLMKFRDYLDSSILECEKFGNGIGKVGYEEIKRTAVRMLDDGTEQEFDVIVKRGPCYDPTSIGRFLMPFYAQDPQLSPWVGEEHSATPEQVLQKEQSGLFRKGTYDKLKAWVALSQTGSTGQERKFENAQEQLEKTQPMWPKKLDWQEIWLSFNIDGDPEERQKEVVIHYHHGAQLIMSARYNWHNDLHRPYRICKYFPVEHRWRGIGIAKQNEQFQREITTQHRQRLDNATIANMRMFRVNRLSGYGPKEPIFPGKMWFLDAMDHLDTIQLGEVYPSSYNNEQASLIYSQQRTGVNEVNLGMPQVGTPGTATSDLARIQEGNKKFDFIYQNISSFVEDIITDVACNIQQFGGRNISYYDRAEDGGLAKQFFELPPSFIRDGLIFKLGRANSQQNELLERQNWVQIAGLLSQYYTGMIQLAEASRQTQLVQIIAERGLQAATEAMQQVLQSYNIRNVDRIIIKEFLKSVQNGTQPVGNVPGGNGQPAAPVVSNGMDNFAQIIQALGNSNYGGGVGVQLPRGSFGPTR